ncbi:MAG: Ig-like domain-containing protein [Betaproteobacteria bacterium]
MKDKVQRTQRCGAIAGCILASMLLFGSGDAGAQGIAESSAGILGAPPAFLGAVSRKTHGAAGSFGLPLSLVVANPTTEPRQSSTASIVMTFDQFVTSAQATLTEGVATVGTLAFSGQDVIVPLSGVANVQYVTVSLANVASAAGSGGMGSVRVGFLFGDTNQSRQVTVADIGAINTAQLQTLTNANFLLDVNVDGKLTVADKGLANANLLKKLPAAAEAAPSVASTSPAANATGVAPNATVSIVFSEPVTTTGNWFQMICASGTRTAANTAVSGDQGANKGTTFTIDPNVDFTPGDVCTVTIFATGISDVDLVDPPDSMLADYSFAFTVGALPGLFEKPHPWNKDVSALAPSARSAAIISTLQGFGGWGNGNALQIDFSIALLTADGTTPRRTIAGTVPYCYNGPDCDAVPLQMPLPVNGNTEGNAGYTCNTATDDCHVLVVERTEKKLYELYNATAAGANFTALGAFVWDLTKQYGDSLRGEQCTSADAAGLPMSALLPTADEVAAGDVPHALRFILPNARMKKLVYVHPATHAGGPTSANADAPPYGVRFRLKASFDETPYSAGAKTILRALKKFGMILSDGGNIALTFADDRLSTAKWAAQGIDSHTFNSIGVNNFDVVDLGAEIPLTYDCVRAP